MANNIMALVCNVCVPKKDDWKWGDKGVLAIAKWYPGAPYYINNTESMGEGFEKFLEEHSHPELPSEYYLVGAHQDNPIRLEYESNSLPVL